MHPLTTGQCATLACLWEVSIPKPGNVHRGADFEDLTFYDFVISAVAIEPAMNAAAQRGLGGTILDAVRATQACVATNTNLGTILLLAPLAMAADQHQREDRASDAYRASLTEVLGSLTAEDAAQTYEAIRLANPGGMGEVEEMDLAEAPPNDLMSAMQAARERDLVARQYCENFAQLLEFAVPSIESGLEAGWTLPQSVVHAHLRLMATWPDSLIARKCGEPTAREAAARANVPLEADGPLDNNYQRGVADLDFWLRSDGHRRNPGTTADMIAASLFVLLRQGRIGPSVMSGREGLATDGVSE